jgi:polyisoprenoid-binding protein YceI
MPPFRRTAGFSATATLSRAAFGADAWTSLIGDQVTLRIEAEARRTGGDPDAGIEAPPQDPTTP